jgi:hypothetical protein
VVTQTKQQTDFIKMVANHLAKNFIASLLELTKEKSYSANMGGLAEIIDWSKEFCDQYYYKVTNWEMFKWSSDNIYNAFTLDDLIVCFGKERLRKFYAQIENHTEYFKEKYSAI